LLSPCASIIKSLFAFDIVTSCLDICLVNGSSRLKEIRCGILQPIGLHGCDTDVQSPDTSLATKLGAVAGPNCLESMTLPLELPHAV
jgi:hypothetical protein